MVIRRSHPFDKDAAARRDETDTSVYYHGLTTKTLYMEKKKKKQAEKENRQRAVYEYIERNYLPIGEEHLRYDTISRRVQIEPPSNSPLKGREFRDLTDADINGMCLAAAEETGLSVRPQEVLIVLNSDRIPRVNPLREYVEQQNAYDAQKEPNWIGAMADQVTLVDESKHELWRRCFSKWFIAMVASWMRDEAVNQQVLVLIGKQGIYKTTWLEHLIPPELRGYTCKMSNTQWTKDDRLRLAEFGLINLDEIDAMNSREVNSLKSLITAVDINERVAYGYTKERRLRLASFCASGNKREFLSDITGNRRWLPFEVASIQSPFTHTFFPYGRMYAEARYMIEHDYPYWFEQDEIGEMAEQQDEFRAQDNEEQLLGVLFDVPADGATGEQVKFLTTAEISQKLVDYGAIKRPMPLNRLGMLLGRKGFKCVRCGTSRMRGWIVYQRDSEEMEVNRKSYAKQNEVDHQTS